MHNFYVGEDAWFGEGAGAVGWGLVVYVCVFGGGRGEFSSIAQKLLSITAVRE